MSDAQAKATWGLWRRMQKIIFYYGRKQGYSDEEIEAMLSAAPKRKQ